MHLFELLNSVDALVLGVIVSSIILAFVLVVIVYALRSKSHLEKIEKSKKVIEAKDDKISKLEYSLHQLQVEDAALQQKLKQFEDIDRRYEIERAKLESRMLEAQKEADALKREVAEQAALIRELRANLKNALANLDMSRDEIDNLRQRNEYWVEQLSDLRAKYDELKLKYKRRRGF